MSAPLPPPVIQNGAGEVIVTQEYEPVYTESNAENLAVVDPNHVRWNYDTLVLNEIPLTVEHLTIGYNSCNSTSVTQLDLSGYQNLITLEVKPYCFRNVKEVKLIGMERLSRVDISFSCFTNHPNEGFNDPDRHFYLKHCPALKQFMLDYFSFSDYSVCEMEDLPSLEVIEMGRQNTNSANFQYASLELRSEWHQRELTSRFAQVDAGHVGGACV